MTNLIIAFALAVGGVLVSAFGLTSIGLSKEIASSISSIIMGGVPYIHKVLEEKGFGRESSISHERFVSLEGYGVPQHRLIIYGTTIVFALLNFLGALSGMIIGALAAEVENVTMVGGLLVPSMLFPIAFVIGRWIGSRSISRGVLTIFLVTLLGRCFASLFDMEITSDEEFLAIFGETKSLGFFAKQLVLGTIIISIPALLGYWRGRKRRLVEYMNQLLKSLPPASRETLLELTYEEAKKFA